MQFVKFTFVFLLFSVSVFLLWGEKVIIQYLTLARGVCKQKNDHLFRSKRQCETLTHREQLHLNDGHRCF